MKSRKPTDHPDNLTVNKNQLQRYALHYKEMIHEIQNRYRTRQAVREAREAGEDEEGAQPMGMRAVGKDASDSTMTRAQLYHSTDPSDVQRVKQLMGMSSFGKGNSLDRFQMYVRRMRAKVSLEKNMRIRT
jgi:hypothetical protein